jgi:subtilisin family serine protease
MAEAFAGCTGHGVRIAVIDSGVHPDHPHIAADRLEPGVAIASDRTLSSEETLDRLGHGTAVMAAIQEKAPEATCLPIRVFHDALKTSAAALVTAIDWAIDQRVDIINLSLGSTNAAHQRLFADAADRALAAGITIVAAREANDTPCWPGALPMVIGVGVDWDCPRDQYRAVASNPSHFLASGYPRPIPGVAPRRNLYGVSFAVAQMSGFAALAVEQQHSARDTPNLRAALEAHALP